MNIKDVINEVFGSECFLPSKTDSVSYHYKVNGDYILVYKEFQNTISVFEDSNEFICILRDYEVKSADKLRAVLTAINIT